MKVKTKILSILLSVMIVITSTIPVSLVAFAGTTEVPNSTQGAGGVGDEAWQYWEDPIKNGYVLRISASAITDSVTDDQMANVNYRYGDGTVAEMRDYPLMLSLKNIHLKNWSGSYKGNISTVLSDMEKETTKVDGTMEAIRLYTYEPYDGKTYKIKGHNSVSNSIYLEDAVKIVSEMYNDKKLTKYDVLNFWYFYTRMATAANADKGVKNGISEGLEKRFLDTTYGVLNNNSRKNQFQSGYVVALYAIYGSTPAKYVAGSSFMINKSRTKATEGCYLWTEGYKSLVFDKCWYGLTGKNKQVGSEYAFISVHDFAEIAAIYKKGNNTEAKKGAFIEGNTFLATKMGAENNAISSIWFTKFISIYGHLVPAYTYKNDEHKSGEMRGKIEGKEVHANQDVPTFTGWCYFEIANGGYEGYKPNFPNVEQIATQVTYNAYLSSDDSLSESNKFGDNGHVMTDCVYLSDIITKDALAHRLNKRNIQSDKNYLTTTVPKSIQLSAPIDKTTYKLKSLNYRIVSAGGKVDTKKPGGTVVSGIYATGQATTSNKIGVKGSDINNSFDNENAQYAWRQRFKLNDAGLKNGQYLSSNGTPTDYMLYNDADGKSEYMPLKDAPNSFGLEAEKGEFNAKDINEKSTSFKYLKCADGGFYPVYKENGDLYICPVRKVTNLLVQIRADYTAKYTKDTLRTDSAGNKKSVTINEYLLTKNSKTSNFVAKTLYSMIDDYSTNQWGDSYNRLNNYSNDKSSGFNAKNYTYAFGSLFSSTANFYQQNYYTSYNDTSDAVIKEAYTISDGISDKRAKVTYRSTITHTAPLIANPLLNAYSYSYISSGFPIWINSYDSKSLTLKDSSTTKSKLFITDFNDTGLPSGSVVRQFENYVTSMFPVTRSNRSELARVTTYYAGLSLNSAEGYNSNVDHFPRYAAEGTIKADTTQPYRMNLNNSKFRTYRDSIKYDHSGNLKYTQKYNQAYFTKLLTTYQKNLYSLRGKLATDLTPSIAKWTYKGTTASDYANVYGLSTDVKSSQYKGTANPSKEIYDGFIRFGTTTVTVNSGKKNEHTRLRTILNNAEEPAALANDSVVSEVSSSVSTGNIFSPTSATLIAPLTQSAFDIPLYYTVKSHNTQPTSPQTIPPTYKYTTNSTTGTTITQTYQDGSESLNVYPEVVMWAESKVSSGGGDPSYTDIVTVGEKMRYIPAMTYTEMNIGSTSVSAQVTGTAVAFDTRAKKLAKKLGVEDTPVLYSGSGLNMAYKLDSTGDIKAYALSFQGNVTADMKEQWRNTNYNADNTAEKAISKLTSNFQAKIDKKLAIYNPDSSTLTEIDKGSSTANLSATAPKFTNHYFQLTIRAGKVTGVEYKVKTGSSSTQSICKYTVKDTLKTKDDGTITGSVVVAFVNEDDKNKPGVYSIAEIKSILEGMRLVNLKYKEDGTWKIRQSVLPACFENGTGTTLPNNDQFKSWAAKENTRSKYGDRYSNNTDKSYYEDCTVLQIREYSSSLSIGKSTTATEQLPLELGPATPSDKNQYFSNGYKGFVTAQVEIRGKDTSTTPSTLRNKVVATANTLKHNKLSNVDEALTNANAKNLVPDFIIADVTINEATGY